MAQIDKPNEYFNTKLYTGNGSTQAVTGVGFQPDWTWIKCRNDAQEPRLVDSVRGTTKYLDASLSIAELTDTNILTSFDTDGFTLGDDAISNLNGNTHVAWNWKAGTTTGIATNGDTTITPSSYSFNQTSGFSVLKYTGNGTSGAGVAHGLNAKPQFFIVKRLDATSDWQVYFQPVLNVSNATKYLVLDGNNEEVVNINKWNGYQPDATNFYLGNDGQTNTSGSDYIGYVFANKAGYSKFGSFTGNGNTDGTFVYLGFKPSFLLIKNASASESWTMLDTKRDINPNAKVLWPNDNYAEYDETQGVDFLSNGFKIRESATGFNGSGNTIIYMAFAENPLVGTNGVPATAR